MRDIFLHPDMISAGTQPPSRTDSVAVFCKTLRNALLFGSCGETELEANLIVHICLCYVLLVRL